MFLVVISSAVVGYFLWSVVRFVQNYHEAKRTGLPIIFTPVNAPGPLWMMLKDFLIPIASRLPLELGTWALRSDIGWTFPLKYKDHARYGDAFVIVGPGELELVLADPPATEDVMRRRNDFVKNPAMYGMLDIYGPNLDTVNGKAWDRHRKVTVPPFNEQNSALVWREAGEQAEQMLAVWSSKRQEVVRSTQRDVHALALNVLCGAGFGVKSSFVDSTLPPSSPSEDQGRSGDRDRDRDLKPQKLGYRESLRLLLADFINVVLLSLLKKGGYPDWALFGGMKKLNTAYEEFKVYMGEMIAHEKEAFARGDVSRHNLLSEMIRALDGSIAGAGLSDEEVYGNLFIYNLAGHDTTAATLHFAITLMAAHPEWQTWVAEEVDAVCKADDTGSLYYEETFPKLKRIHALMYETLRLYGPVVLMPRYTADEAQKLVIQDRVHVVPAHTTISHNFAALHRHPKYWGPDADEWRPDRWLVADGTKDGGQEEASLFQPAPGSFVPWNAGPRVCPGKKFSQVEFTRVIFHLFADGSRVRLVPEDGERYEDVKIRALQTVDAAKVVLTLKMSGTERIGLQWFRQS
ncbi:hypothetical protein PV08_11755 [Exophiala spinifera]|uniref:Cytochrome P450 n=1 Tax=Exophiala spinifera TaxID=91928 RepID=A0A0D2BF74_9EURO|nr:uncharacterized protein PV08_11755 [Exophiala spinifera]KIW09979.1 hypothetical protein PV08_11755 [Exophiala spinifera]